jgi:hypothetical protein
VFGSGGSATQTGTGILEPTILTYFFVYLTLVGEFCGSALTVAIAPNAMIGTSAKRSKQQLTAMKDFRFIDGN